MEQIVSVYYGILENWIILNKIHKGIPLLEKKKKTKIRSTAGPRILYNMFKEIFIFYI